MTTNLEFELHAQLAKDCAVVGELSLSKLLLSWTQQNNRNY
jgi:hypothetical protein